MPICIKCVLMVCFQYEFDVNLATDDLAVNAVNYALRDVFMWARALFSQLIYCCYRCEQVK